jgi:hypothetical protein
MSWKPIGWLLALIALTGGFIAVFEQGTRTVGLVAPLDAPLLTFEKGTVTGLTMSVSNLDVACTLRGQTWFMTRPVETRADAARIRQLLDALHRTRRREVLSPSLRQQRGLSMESFGLDHPRARCVVGVGQRQDEIVFGSEAPLGDLVYARLNGADDVLALTRDFEQALPASVDEMRDRSVFPAAVASASRIEIKHAGGFVQLALRGGEWRIQQPRDARADTVVVEWLLKLLKGLRVEGFGSPILGADPVAYGLGPDDAVLQVSVWPIGAAEGITLWLGKLKQTTPAVFYARISDSGIVCLVGDAVLPLIGLKAETLRDRRLCDANPALLTSVTLFDRDQKLVLEHPSAEGWVITEPIRSRAESRAVGTFLKTVCGWKGEEVTGEAATNAASQTAREALIRLSLSEAPVGRSDAVTNGNGGGEALHKRWTYLVGTNVESNTCMVVRQEDQAVFRMAVADLTRTFKWRDSDNRVNLADPLGYMDRRVLDGVAEHVRRLTLTQGGREETLVKDATGNWTVDSPPGGQMAEGAVPALLGLVSDLQAVRVESVAATNTVRYGFDEMSPRLTFGLTGMGGIQKTILLGGADAHEGVYAMVQGQDVVFVLPKQVAEVLTRSLVMSP